MDESGFFVLGVLVALLCAFGVPGPFVNPSLARESQKNTVDFFSGIKSQELTPSARLY
jgi:hypothetical protein